VLICRKSPAEFAAARAARGAAVRRHDGEVGINRLLARLRHVFSWAIRNGYTDATPFRRHGETVVTLETRAETARTRRLQPGEEERLVRHAEPHLRALMAAALSTSCRLGELLGMQWRQVHRDEHGVAVWIALAASQTKTNTAREIPIGSRLRAALEMRKHGPDGKDHGADDYVFGNECGEEIKSIKTAWRATCRRAGISNLHFHDLRREFGSRLLESGADQHDVRDFLGHANITTTSRYLMSTPKRLAKAMERLESSIRTSFTQTADSDTKPDAAAPASDVPKSQIQQGL
jgi:integrase